MHGTKKPARAGGKARTLYRTGALTSLAALVTTGFIVAGGAAPAWAARVDATCSNSSSDAATIQAAVTASAPGDEVVIKGPCSLTSTVRLLDNRTYRGDSRGGTVIKQANGANLPALLATSTWTDNVSYVNSGITVESLTLDGNKASNTSTVPLVVRAWDSRVSDVEIENAPGDGLQITSLSRNLTHVSAGTEVNSVISDIFVHDSANNGINVIDPDNVVTDWVLERGWIASSGADGVRLDNTAGWQIRDMHLYGVQKNAIDAQRCFNTGIDGNYIEDFGHEGTSGTTYYGIRCTIQGGVANVISGNKVNNVNALPAAGSFVSIGLDGVNYGSGHAAVTGNAIVGRSDPRETGLSYQRNGGTALNVVSTGNLVDNVGTTRTTGSGVTVTTGQ